MSADSAVRGLTASFAALPAAHRRTVAQEIGAADAQAGTLAGQLLDPDSLDGIIAKLPAVAQAALTRLAFVQLGAWSAGRQAALDPQILFALERRGLIFAHKTRWRGDDAWAVAGELIPGVQRSRGRAHAALIPSAPLPPEATGIPEQILHDVAVVGSVIATGAVRLKADGDLFARARPLLLAALSELPLLGGEEDYRGARLAFALEFLQQSGSLRVVSHELPGGAPRRQLALARHLVELLEQPAPERAALLDSHLAPDAEELLWTPLLDALAGRSVTVTGLGEAVWRFVREAGYRLSLPPGVPDVAGELALLGRWLRGEVLLGEDSDESLVVSFTAAVVPSYEGPLCVAQADFELVLLRAPLPHERAGLLLVGEAERDREHVVRLTRERTLAATGALRSIGTGRRGGADDIDPFLGLLRSLAGELPPNVARTIGDWIGQAPRAARLRSAVFVEVEAAAGDTAAAALGSLLVRRLGPGLLAVPADRLAEVGKALRKAGVELEPGVERLSGRWDDRSRGDDTDLWWRPRRREAEPVGRRGTLRSGLAELESQIAAMTAATTRAPPRARQAPAAASELEQEDYEEAGETILEAWESGLPIVLRYAGAGGITTELVRVLTLDGARFRVAGVNGGGESWRWVRAVLEAGFRE